MNLNEVILAISLYIIPAILVILLAMCIYMLGGDPTENVMFFPLPVLNILICIISLIEIFCYLIPKKLVNQFMSNYKFK